ncbi:MAG: LysR family transcriptional regulator, partial [Lachnospiraceae bacterium]|nr:LysR family transcriptional regulator [Lachnospiraceae bacterium]
MEQSLVQYKTFYEVANAENISKAARILMVSQPAVSKSLKKLEQDLGIKLFDRSSISFELTPQGKLLYDHLNEAFNHIKEAENKLKVFSNINFGHLRIGVSQTLAK